MKVKEKYLNFYYETIGEIEEPKIDPKKTALLIVDLQNEIVANKTTDSVTTGTNYLQLLQFMEIETVIVTGIVTDQCVASTVRGLADAGYNVICVEDFVFMKSIISP